MGIFAVMIGGYVFRSFRGICYTLASLHKLFSSMPCLVSVAAERLQLMIPGQKARNEAEKHRRDRINRGVSTLSGMVGPAYLPKQQKKIDKITTLRLAANFMRRAFIQCFVESLNEGRRPVLPEQIIEVIQNFAEDSGFWLTVNRRGKILDVTEGIQHLLGYNLVDVADENLAKLVDESQREILMTEKLLGYPEDGSGMVPKNVTIYMLPKPTGRKDTLRSGCALHVRGFIGPIEALLGSSEHSDDKLAEEPGEPRKRPGPDDDVILVARVTPAGGRLTMCSYVEPRPENEYLLEVRSDGVIVGSDSRISICAGFLPSEVQLRSAHSFLHVDDQMWAAVRQGLMFLYPKEFNSVTVRLLSNTNEVAFVYVRGNLDCPQPNLPEGHFTCRQVIISEDEARKLRREEMAQLQQFFRDVVMGHYPQQQVLAMVAAIMGPMLGQPCAFAEAKEGWSDEFSAEFNLRMFRTLADFTRALPPLPDVPGGWPAAACRPDDRVSISELPPQALVPPVAAAEDAVPRMNGGVAGGAGGNGDVAMADMEPLRVDTCSDSELNSLLSGYSGPWHGDNEAVAVSAPSAASGPSPSSSELSSATYPSPTSTTTFLTPQQRVPSHSGPTADPQFSQCSVQQSPSSSHCYAAVSPCYTQKSPGYCSVSPGYAGTSPAQQYPSPAAGSAVQHSSPNGQTLMSPPCGNVVRQSCQFQPGAAPLSTQFQQSVMFMQQATPAQSFMPDNSQNCQGGFINRHSMAQPMDESSASAAAVMSSVADLSLDLAADLPLLMTPLVSGTPAVSDDVIANWANS